MRRHRWRWYSRRRSQGLGLGDVAGCPPDNDGELGLVVGLLGYGGILMTSPGPIIVFGYLAKTMGFSGISAPVSAAWSS